MEPTAQQNFDVWKREATKLERQLEDRVAHYQQLVQRLNQAANHASSMSMGTRNGNDLLGGKGGMDLEAGGSTSSGNNVPYLLQQSDQLQKELQRHLTQLSDLLQTRLGPAAEQSGKAQHLLLVKRYREVLFDLSSDVQKTTQQMNRTKDQLELFAGRNSGANGSGMAGEDDGMQHLLRERGHINNSLSASAAVINQASEIHSDLRQQGASLRNNVQAVVQRILTNVPQANQLITNIRRRRNQNDIVLACVIASCVLFTLWYLFG